LHLFLKKKESKTKRSAKELYVIFFRQYVDWDKLSIDVLQKMYGVLIEDIKYRPAGETCVVCGAPVSEGRQVCPACEQGKRQTSTS